MATLLRSFNELTSWQPFCINGQTYCSSDGEYCTEQRIRCSEQGVDCREPCRLGRRDDYPRNGWDPDVVDIGRNNEVINDVSNDQVSGFRGLLPDASGARLAPVPHTNVLNFHTFRKQAAILKEVRENRDSNTTHAFPAFPAQSEPEVFLTRHSGLPQPHESAVACESASMRGVQQLHAAQAKAYGGRAPSRPRMHNVHPWDKDSQKHEAESPSSFKGFDADSVDSLCIQTLSEAVDRDIKERAASSSDPAEMGSSSSQCHQDDWNEGQVRVLVVFGPGQNESEPLDRIERWCRLCKITDVQTLEVSPSSEHMLMRILTDALTALGARCSPGDVCTVFLARLPEICNPEEATPSFSSPIFLSCLPSHVTVVCISDERNSLERVGLDERSLQKYWSDNLRAIVMLVSSRGLRKGSFFVDVLLETSRALSLLDGPCGLNSQAFFEELSDQALDLATISGVGAPQMSIHSHPNNDVASDVRWPIAKAPQNGSRKRSVSRNELDGCLSPCANEPVERRETHYANIAKVVACTEARAARELPLPPQLGDNDDVKAESPSPLFRKGRAGNSGTPKKRRPARSTSNKTPTHAGSVPGNINQMAAMFSGGFLDKAGHESRGLARSPR